MTILAILVLLLALLPAILTLANIAVLRTPAAPAPGEAGNALVSILIPARNEAAILGPTLAAALASLGIAVEVVVGDDGSTDGTAELVGRVAAADARLRLIEVPPLPRGWTGKNHACAALARAARGSHLLFLDADVRIAPEGAARLLAHALRTEAVLVSGVPRQETVSLGEMLTVPFINLLLLGYLPIALSRKRPDPALGTACGQMILVERAAYEATAGHGAIGASLHDGVALPRVFRQAGLRTDLVRGADLATCRMYGDLAGAWAGFAKNAHEGLATPRALPVWTVLLLGGHVMPYALAALALFGAAPAGLAVAALGLALLTRTASTLASRERLATIPLHPATVMVGVALQWWTLLGGRRRAAIWKGRAYPVS